MLRGQPRGAERPVLLLRMLQDQKCDPVIDRRDAIADAERLRLLAMRTFRDHLFVLLLAWVGHPPAIRRGVPTFNQPIPHGRASETRRSCRGMASATPPPSVPTPSAARGTAGAGQAVLRLALRRWRAATASASRHPPLAGPA